MALLLVAVGTARLAKHHGNHATARTAIWPRHTDRTIIASTMAPSVQAGIVYFLIVFAAGFLMGTIRVLTIAPAVGETLAVLIELPVMLAVSWFASRAVVARLAVPGRLQPRLVMGGVAFALLMLAEIGVSVFALQRSIGAHFEAYLAVPALLGLAGQIAFALFPAVQLRRV